MIKMGHGYYVACVAYSNKKRGLLCCLWPFGRGNGHLFLPSASIGGVSSFFVSNRKEKDTECKAAAIHLAICKIFLLF